MATMLVRGGVPLNGKIAVSGAKNAVLPLLAAALMANDGKTKLESVPRLNDVSTMLEVISHLGGTINSFGEEIEIDCQNLNGNDAPYNLISQMRASVLIMGPLLEIGRAHV